MRFDKLMFLLSLICCGLVTVCNATVGNTIYTISFSPNQVLYSDINAQSINSFGVGFCVIQRYNNTWIECTIQHNIEELEQATINSGFRGETGNVLHSFSLNQGYRLHGKYFFDNSTLNTLLDGGWYVNLITRDFPQGELRGQIEQRDRFFAYLAPQYTIPRSSGTDATGVAVASYSFESRVVDIDLVHSVSSTSATQLGLGDAGRAGIPVRTFYGDSPSFPYAQLTRTEIDALFDDGLFLNVLSFSNPKGEIRGQLVTVDYIQPAFSSRLSGDAYDGNAIFSYNCNTRVVEFVVLHSLVNATNAILFTNYAQINLTGAESPLFGSVLLSKPEEASFYNGTFEIQITSVNDSTISGKISDSFSHYAYVTGSQVVPPVTTHYKGLMLLQAGRNSSSVSYQLIHNVPNPDLVGFWVGLEGDNTNMRFAIISNDTFTQGILNDLSSTEVSAIFQGSAYLEIRVGASALIRGQIERFASSCDIVTYDYLSLGNSNNNDGSTGQQVSSNQNGNEDEQPFDDDEEFVVYIKASSSTLLPSLAILVCMLLL